MNFIRWCLILHFSLMSVLCGLLAFATGYLQGTRFLGGFPNLFHSPFFWIALLSIYACCVVGLVRWQDWGRYLGIFICSYEIISIAIIEVFRIGAGRPHVLRFLIYGAELYWFLIPEVRMRFSRGIVTA